MRIGTLKYISANTIYSRAGIAIFPLCERKGSPIKWVPMTPLNLESGYNDVIKTYYPILQGALLQPILATSMEEIVNTM